MIAQSIEPGGPISPIRREPLFQFHEGLRLRAIEATLRVNPNRNESSVAKYTKVPRHARLAEAGNVHQITDAEFPVANGVEEITPRPVS
jgi:hypothetical protein